MTTTTITLISFGYLHGPAPDADHVLDVRHILRDPAAAKAAGILDMNGRSRKVREVVLHTEGCHDVLEAQWKLLDDATGPVTLAIGCEGGKHRAPALVEFLADWVVGAGRPVTIVHRDIHRPRLRREVSQSTPV